MNGYIVISLENGLMLFTHTINNYGLSSSSSSSMSDPLEISSYLYAIYTLSKSYYDDYEEDDQGDSASGAGMINGSIVTGFRESPISYFQHESIFWHFYESCGKDSDILTIVSSNCQIDHQYSLLFAAKLSQNFLTTSISDCVSPRSGISKQVKENYKLLLELRVKEIIYYLFDNLFVCSSSLGLIYVPEECSSMISFYQFSERGKYILESNELALLEVLSSQWNGPPSPAAMTTTKEEEGEYEKQQEEAEGETERERREEDQVHSSDSSHVSPPQPRCYQTSVSEAKLSPASPVESSSTTRPHTAGDSLRSSESTVLEEGTTTADEGGFLKSSIQWVKKRFTFKRNKSQARSITSSSAGVANEAMESMSQGSQHSRDHMTAMDRNRSRSTSAPAEVSQNDSKHIQWQLFHLDEQSAEPELQQQQEQERRESGYPEMLSQTSVPWLLQLIQTYQEHQLHVSHQDRISSMTTSLPPFILTTSFPSNSSLTDSAIPPSLAASRTANAADPSSASSSEQWVHLLNLSNSLYSSLSSRNLNVFLVWNEAIGSEEQERSRQQEASKEKIAAVFQSTSELKLLFLEFLELNLQLHKH